MTAKFVCPHCAKPITFHTNSRVGLPELIMQMFHSLHDPFALVPECLYHTNVIQAQFPEYSKKFIWETCGELRKQGLLVSPKRGFWRLA